MLKIVMQYQNCFVNIKMPSGVIEYVHAHKLTQCFTNGDQSLCSNSGDTKAILNLDEKWEKKSIDDFNLNNNVCANIHGDNDSGVVVAVFSKKVDGNCVNDFTLPPVSANGIEQTWMKLNL